MAAITQAYAALNAQPGVVTTRFYPRVISDAVLDLSAGNVPTPQQLNYESDMGGVGTGLPVLWWLGIIIILVALRLAYEFA